MKFDDLEGNEVTQTFYFNYNKKEIAELLEFKQLEEKLKLLTMPVEESGLSQVENNQQAYDIFQDLILDAYGVKGVDNVTFVKNEELREYWRSHVAFVEMIFEFLENPQLAAQFIENCLPAKMVARAKEEMQAANDNKLSSSTITEMAEEAARRQENPETRIEPGLKAAQEAGVAPVDFEAAGIEYPQAVPAHVPESGPIVTDGKTDEELLTMKPQEMTQPQLMRAFELKSKA